MAEEASTAESQTEDTESEDCLPELVSDETDTSKDSGYAFLNTPPSTEEEDGDDAKAEEREKRNKKYTRDRQSRRGGSNARVHRKLYSKYGKFPITKSQSHV